VAVSERNVEIVRVAIELWNRGDVDAVVDAAAPDTVMHPFPEWPGDQVYRGRDGWRRLIDEWLENFDEIRWDIERLIDAGDQVVALVHHRCRIKGTGVPIAQPLGAVFADFRQDGKVGTAHFFLSWPEALETAGLERQQA
jgi:ketosteroid isomerase-like protein